MTTSPLPPSPRSIDDRAEPAVSVEAALRELVELKDGLRDDRYRARKDWAWEQARQALAAIRSAREETP